MGQIVFHGKRHLALIGSMERALTLHLMRYAAALKKPSDYKLPSGQSRDSRVSARELELAEKLVAELSGPWKPEEYKNSYYRDIMTAVKSREHAQVSEPQQSEDEAEKTLSQVLDLMPLLEKSLRAKAQKKQKPSRKGARRLPQRPSRSDFQA